MKSKTKQISNLIRNAVLAVDPDAEIILYGSRARGDERPDSDWDILILTNVPTDNNKEDAFRDKIYDLELETGEPFSIFIYSKQNWNSKQRITPYYQNVMQEGIML